MGDFKTDEKLYPVKLIDVVDSNNHHLILAGNKELDDAIIFEYNKENKLINTFDYDMRSPYVDYIDMVHEDDKLLYVHPDVKETLVEVLLGSTFEEKRLVPFKNLINKITKNNSEIILNDVDSVLKENNKTSKDDNSCMEDLFKSLNNLKESFQDVVEKMDNVKGVDCLCEDEYYPFKIYSINSYITLREVSSKITKWVDSITKQNKEAGNIK